MSKECSEPRNMNNVTCRNCEKSKSCCQDFDDNKSDGDCSSWAFLQGVSSAHRLEQGQVQQL